MELLQEDFEAMLASAITPVDISKYFAEDYDWEFDTYEERDAAIIKAAERAIELVATVQDGIDLFRSFLPIDGLVTAEHDTRVFNKVVDLATTGEDIDTIYSAFYLNYIYHNHTDIACRNHIRKIFDKADELGLEASTHIRN